MSQGGEIGGGARDVTRMSVWQLVLLPVLAFIGMAFGMLLDVEEPCKSSLLARFDVPCKSREFASTPQFHIWLLILCASAAVWALAGAFLVGFWRTRRRALRLRPGDYVSIFVAVAALALPSFVLLSVLAGVQRGPLSFEDLPESDQFPLTHHKTKILLIVSIALLISAAAIMCMWAIAIAMNRLRPGRPGQPKPQSTDLKKFLGLRRDLGALLGLNGLLIGLGTLSAGALRNAVLAANSEPYVDSHPDEKLEFASEYVVVYGLFFTGLLAIAFVPGFLAMRSAGARLRDAAIDLPAPSDPDFDEAIAKRKALDVLLETNLSATASFKAAVVIFTPLAGSLLALVLPR